MAARKLGHGRPMISTWNLGSMSTKVGLQDLGDGLAGDVAGVEADLHAEALLRRPAPSQASSSSSAHIVRIEAVVRAIRVVAEQTLVDRADVLHGLASQTRRRCRHRSRSSS